MIMISICVVQLKTLAVIVKKINLAKFKIRLIFGLAVFCHEFEFLAKLQLTENNYG